MIIGLVDINGGLGRCQRHKPRFQAQPIARLPQRITQAYRPGQRTTRKPWTKMQEQLPGGFTVLLGT